MASSRLVAPSTAVLRSAAISGFGLTSNAGENRQPLHPRRKPWFRRWSSVLLTAILKAILRNSSWRSAFVDAQI